MNQASSAKVAHALLFNGILSAQGMFAQGASPHDFGGSFTVFSAVRHALHGRMASGVATSMGRADFVHHVALHLPDVSERIAEDDFGVLHLEMGAMKLATQDAIRHHELHTVRRHFAFIAYLYEHADNALYNAILVSYLEALFMDETAPAYENARSLLPPSLAEALKRAELRHTLLHGAWRGVARKLALARAPDSVSTTSY